MNFKTVKCRYTDILHYGKQKIGVNYYNFEDSIDRTDKLAKLCHIFIRAYLLYLYEKDSTTDLPIITREFIGRVYKVLSIGTNRGRHAKIVNNLIFDELNDYYENKFKGELDIAQKIDGSNLSFLLDEMNGEMITSIDNNIKHHFDKHLSKFIFVHFKKQMNDEMTNFKEIIKSNEEQINIATEELTKIVNMRKYLKVNIIDKISYHNKNIFKNQIDVLKEIHIYGQKEVNVRIQEFKKFNIMIRELIKKKKSIWKTNLRKIKDDILNNTEISITHKSWIDEHRHNLMPKDKTFKQIIKEAPSIMIKYMFNIGKYLEKENIKGFQAFPIKTSVYPNYVKINTSALIQIFVTKNEPLIINGEKMTKNFASRNATDLKTQLWDKYFNISKFKLKNHTFNGQISTDGFAVSIGFILNSDKIEQTQIKENKKNKKKESDNVKKSIKNNIMNDGTIYDIFDDPYDYIFDDDLDDQLDGQLDDQFDDPLDYTFDGPFDDQCDYTFDNTMSAMLDDISNGTPLSKNELIENTFAEYISNKELIKEVNDDKKNEDYKKEQKKIKEIAEKKTKEELKKEELDRALSVEFPYIEDIVQSDIKNEKHKELIEKYKEGKIVCIDPGKRSILTLIADDIEKQKGKTEYGLKDYKFMNYSNKERVRALKRLKYGTLIENKKKKTKIGNVTAKSIENELCDFNSKSCNYKKFIDYVIKKREIDKQLFDMYNDNYFRKLKWFAYLNKRRHEDKLLNKIENKFGKDIIILMGDWGGKGRVKYMSTPNIGIKRKLNERFKKMYLIDEYNTSKLHYKHEIECENLRYKIKEVPKKKQIRWKEKGSKKWETRYISRKVKKKEYKTEYKEDTKGNKIKAERKTRKLHSVLTYKLENNVMGCINRDKNACMNFKKIVKSLIDTKERPNKYKNRWTIKNVELNIQMAEPLEAEEVHLGRHIKPNETTEIQKDNTKNKPNENKTKTKSRVNLNARLFVIRNEDKELSV